MRRRIGRCQWVETAMGRELNVAPEVAAALPAAHLAHAQSRIDDDDSTCTVCEQVVHGQAAELVLFRDRDFLIARMLTLNAPLQASTRCPVGASRPRRACSARPRRESTWGAILAAEGLPRRGWRR
jgi:hypothetical protein